MRTISVLLARLLRPVPAQRPGRLVARVLEQRGADRLREGGIVDAERDVFPGAFAAFLLALALTADRRGNPLETPALHALGEISYATYLGHFLLFGVFKLAFVEDARAIPPVLIALYLTLVLGSSVALHHLVERPAQDWMNRLPTRWQRRGARVQASSSAS